MDLFVVNVLYILYGRRKDNRTFLLMFYADKKDTYKMI